MMKSIKSISPPEAKAVWDGPQKPQREEGGRGTSAKAVTPAEAQVARMIERAAAGAGLELKAHPHMLRHALWLRPRQQGHDTRAIQAWLGHRSITSTAVYTALAPNRFKDSPRRASNATPEPAM
jgi:integrase